MDFLIMTDEEKQEYSNTESDDTSSDYTPSHHEYSDDEDGQCFCSSCSELKEDLTEEDIDVRLFPCNNFYQKLGIDYIMARNDLLPDENMFPLYEKMSEDMACPSEDWERQKKQKTLAYTEIKNSNDNIIEYL